MSATQTNTSTNTKKSDRHTANIGQSFLSASIEKCNKIFHQYLPSETQSSIRRNISIFVHDKPLLASFLVSNLVISGLPVLLFLVFAITLSVITLTTAIVFGLLAAAFFILFMLGGALFLIIPIFSFTTFIAVTTWLLVITAFYVVKWTGERGANKDDLSQAAPERQWSTLDGSSAQVILPSPRHSLHPQNIEDFKKAQWQCGSSHANE